MSQNIKLNLEPLDLEGNTIRNKIATKKKYKIVSGIFISIAAIVFLIASLYSAIYYLCCLPFIAAVIISDIFKRKEITKEFENIQLEHTHKMNGYSNNGVKVFDLEKGYSSLGFDDKSANIYLYQYGKSLCSIPYKAIVKTDVQTYEKRNNYFIGLELTLDSTNAQTFDIILPSYRDSGNNRMSKKIIQNRFEQHQQNLLEIQKHIDSMEKKNKNSKHGK